MIGVNRFAITNCIVISNVTRNKVKKIDGRRLTTWLLAVEAVAARSVVASLRALYSPLRQIYNVNG